MKLIRLLLPAALLLVSSLAFAGAFQVAKVTIDLDDKWAEGNLIAARFSENDEERIGCAVGNGVLSPNYPGETHYAYCEATDGDGVDAFCITYDAAMIDTIASINTFSYVYFQWGSEAGADRCTHVTVATRSIHIPKKIKMEVEIEE